MTNELKDICEKLQDSGGDGFQVLSATKTPDGRWYLIVKRIAEDNEEDKEC